MMPVTPRRFISRMKWPTTPVVLLGMLASRPASAEATA
jgi:hypothetical protein